jgi:hypothetical protein
MAFTGSTRGVGRRLILASVLAWATLASCESNIQLRSRAIDGVFPPTRDLPPLPFRLTDETGLVQALAVVKPGNLQDGVSPLPGRDDAVYVQWTGGACDRLAMVVFEHGLDGHQFTITTERDFGGCRMIGIPRSLTIEFTQPVDAATVSLDTVD